MNCYNCNTELIWGGDNQVAVESRDKGYLLTTNLSCPQCNAYVEVSWGGNKIEDIILSDSKINFNNRKNILHVLRDNYNRRFSVNYKSIRNKIESTDKGLYQWI